MYISKVNKLKIQIKQMEVRERDGDKNTLWLIITIYLMLAKKVFSVEFEEV